jgi:hypothetical protein
MAILGSNTEKDKLKNMVEEVLVGSRTFLVRR